MSTGAGRSVHETPTPEGAPHPAPQVQDGIGRGGGLEVVRAEGARPPAQGLETGIVRTLSASERNQTRTWSAGHIGHGEDR